MKSETARLFTVATIVRETIEPQAMPREVTHFSIPSLESTGRPARDLSADIQSNKLRLRGGEVLISRLNPRKSRVVLVPEKLDAFSVASTEFVAAMPGPRLDARYLTYVLTAPRTIAHLDSQVRSVTRSHQRVEPETIAALPIPLPPVEEQRRIANYLDDQTTRIDQAIQLRQREMGLVEERRRILLSDLYFGTGQPLGRLKQIAYVAHGRQRSPEHEKGNFMTPYVRSANVSDGAINTDDVKEMNFNPQERVRYGLRRGDVLVTEAAGSVEAIGASAQWTAEWRGPICFQNHLLRVRARDGLVTPDYLHWWARAAWASGAMRVWATGANILNLGSESLRNAPIPVRSLSEQNLLANRCNELDDWATSAGNSLEASVALLTDRRRSLITAAISGEMDALSAAEVRDLRGR